MSQQPARRGHRSAPLVPAPWRTRALLLAAASAVGVAVLGAAVAGETSHTRADAVLGPTVLYRPLYAHRDTVAALSHLADPAPLVALALLTVAAALVGRRPAFATLAVLAPLVTVGITEALKPLVDRRLGGGLAFPSGHAGAGFGVALVAAGLALTRSRRRWLGATIAVALLVLAVVAALGIVVSGDHYPSDVVGAAGVALTTCLTLAVGIDAVVRRATG